MIGRGSGCYNNDLVNQLSHPRQSLGISSTINARKEKYDGRCYGLRTRLYNDFLDGAKSPRSIYHDELAKLSKADGCAYCGKHFEPASLTLDHLFPRARGGEDSGDNLVYCCRSCNSSKGKQDLMVWLHDTDRRTPVSTMRRYLKNAIRYCDEHELMDKSIAEIDVKTLPFDITALPRTFDIHTGKPMMGKGWDAGQPMW